MVIEMSYIATDKLINTNHLDDSIDHSPNTIIMAEPLGKTLPKCSQLTTGEGGHFVLDKVGNASLHRDYHQ